MFGTFIYEDIPLVFSSYQSMPHAYVSRCIYTYDCYFSWFFLVEGRSHYSVTTLKICQALIMPYNWQLEKIKTINLVNRLPEILALWNLSLMHYQVSPIPFTNFPLYKLSKVTV